MQTPKETTTKKKKYRYNLKDLEDKCLVAYKSWEKHKSEHTRTQIFITVRDLAFAVLSVGNYEKYQIDYERTAYEYALYLFERIVIGSFKMQGYRDRFPLQHYMRKNIKHVIFTMKDAEVWKEVVGDLEFLMSTDEIRTNDETMVHLPTQGDIIDRNVYAAKLLDLIRMFYPYEEIRRLLPIALDHIYGNWYLYFSDKVPKDVQDFVIILISSAKRIVRIENIFYGMDVKRSTMKRSLHAAVRSTVFLSTIVNTKFIPKEFLLALDLDSLYRLVSVMGGRTVKIPTIRELDTLIGGVVAASKMILEGKEAGGTKRNVKNARKDYDLAFSSHIDIQYFVSKAVENFHLFKDGGNSSEPLINLLASSISSLDKLFQSKEFQKKLESDPSVLLKQYCELSASFTKITESLLTMSAHASDGMDLGDKNDQSDSDA